MSFSQIPSQLGEVLAYWSTLVVLRTLAQIPPKYGDKYPPFPSGG